ncbi:hypothetical protein F5883DRAFT_246599 [Diaporthe sp. PMI_573]|nr:hypothetical protein F5883DRAFT_246599 [Diaporthaceae sp. PMI_573]
MENLLGAKHPVGNTCWVCSVASPLSKATEATRGTRTCDLGTWLAGSSWAFFYAGTIIARRNNDKTDPDSSPNLGMRLKPWPRQPGIDLADQGLWDGDLCLTFLGGLARLSKLLRSRTFGQIPGPLSITLITSVRSVGLLSDSSLVLGLESFHLKTKSVAWGSPGLLSPTDKDNIIKFPNLFSLFSFPHHEHKKNSRQQPRISSTRKRFHKVSFRAVRSVDIPRLTIGCWRLNRSPFSVSPSFVNYRAADTPCSPGQVRIFILHHPPSGSGSGSGSGTSSIASSASSLTRLQTHLVDHSFPHLAGKGPVIRFYIASCFQAPARSAASDHP